MKWLILYPKYARDYLKIDLNQIRFLHLLQCFGNIILFQCQCWKKKNGPPFWWKFATVRRLEAHVSTPNEVKQNPSHWDHAFLGPSYWCAAWSVICPAKNFVAPLKEGGAGPRYVHSIQGILGKGKRSYGWCRNIWGTTARVRSKDTDFTLACFERRNLLPT